MSLAFQNDSEAVKQVLLEELQNLLSSDTVVRQSAEKRMRQLEYTEGYGVYLSELIMNQSFDLPLRQIACIMLTRYVESHWTENNDDANKNEGDGGGGDGIATEQAKRTIRNILPNGLYDPNSKIRSSVAHTIATIAATDYHSIWTEFFDIIIKCLGGNEDSIHGAMQILQEFPYDAKHIKELGPIIMSEVHRILESEQNYSIKTRVSAIRILKPLFMSISTFITDKKEQSSMMDSILSNFMTQLLHYLSMSSTGSSFLLRTEIVKVFTFLVVDMSRYIQPYMAQILPIIWQLLTQVADTYVKVLVNQTEPSPFTSGDTEDDDEQTNFQTLIIQIMEFINVVVTSTKLRSHIKNVLTDLIYIVILYIQVPVELIDDWIEDPDKFVDDEDDGGVELTVRLCGQDLLLAINDELDVRALPSLQEALVRHFNVAEAEKTAGNANWWKIQEACMMAVHVFRDVILKNDTKFDLLNYLTIVRNCLNYQESPHLVGRALWTLSTHSKSELYNLQMLSEILDVTICSLLSEKPYILRISAVRAVHGFLLAHESSEGEKRALIVSKLGSFLDGIMSIVAGCKSSLLSLILEALATIINFDIEFSYTAHGRIIPFILAVFLKYSEDPFILEMVQDLIRAICHHKQCLQPLQDKFIPTIVNLLSEDAELANSTKQGIALDVLTTIVKYSSTPLSNALIDSAFPAVINCIKRTDDHAVMVAGGECLRAFIFASSEQICNFKNGDGLNYVMEVTIMLLNPMNNEMTAGQIGRLVITIISKMGNMLGSNIDMLLKAVISKMQLVECLKVIMSLVVIFAHLFLTQMEAVLNFLSTVPGPTGEPALQYVLSNWLSKQSSFFGSYERKVTTMALCKLFEYGITTQDNRLTAIIFKELSDSKAVNIVGVRTRSQSRTQEWIALPALVKIFKLLINELWYLNEMKMASLDVESDDDADTSGENPANDSNERYVSDLYYEDEDDEADDDQMLKELDNDAMFTGNMEENLKKFLKTFSHNEHFPMFYEHLDAAEKKVWNDLCAA